MDVLPWTMRSFTFQGVNALENQLILENTVESAGGVEDMTAIEKNSCNGTSNLAGFCSTG